MKNDGYVMMLLREITCDISSKMNKLYEPYGVTMIQFEVLMELSMEDNITISTLANRLNMSISNLSAILQRLEKHNFVVRIRDENDQRTVRVKMSKQCHKMIKELEATFDQIDVLANVQDEDFDLVCRGLEKLKEILKECEIG